MNDSTAHPTGREPRAIAPLLSPFAGTTWDRARLAMLLFFFTACILGGGASRADVVSLLYVRPIAILTIAALLILPGPHDWRPFRTLFLLLAAFAATMGLQLVPLSPDLWLSLPGREIFGRAAQVAGAPQPWAPISLAPDLTINSLLALLPAATMVVGFATIRPYQRFVFLPAIMICTAASAALGIFQLTSDPHGPAYLYNVTHSGSAVGFFANRNHQAALLACTIPLLRIWTLMPTEDRQWFRVRRWVAAVAGLSIIPMILVTGSRAGLALGLVGFLAAYAVAPVRPTLVQSGWRRTALTLAMVTAPLAMIATVLLLGRAEAIQRLFVSGSFEDEDRFIHLPQLIQLARDYFPFGIGAGAFDPVYRVYEPDALLRPTYQNHVHNDLVELVLTLGLAGVVVFLLFMIWFIWHSFFAFRHIRSREPARLLARAGSAIIVILFLASLVDYPLRTPLLSVIFAIAACWLAAGSRRRLPVA